MKLVIDVNKRSPEPRRFKSAEQFHSRLAQLISLVEKIEIHVSRNFKADSKMSDE